MKKFFKVVFSSIEPSYLKRQYFFGTIVTILFIFASVTSSGSTPIIIWIWLLLNLLLYPFSVFVFDRIMELFFGNSILIGNFIFMSILSIIKIFILYFFSFFIAPIGMVYIYYSSTSIYNLPEIINMKFWQRAALNIIIFFGFTYLSNKVHIMSWLLAILVAVGLSALNTLIRPLINFLSLPMTVVSLGLSYFVINGLTIWIASHFAIGIFIYPFVTKLIFSLLLSITNLVIKDVENEKTIFSKQRSKA